MSTEYLNGVRNYYGPRGTEDLYGAGVKTDGHTTQLEWVFNYDDLPVYQASGAGALVIPQYSIITSARMYAITGLATSTAMTVGLTDDDGGGAMDADGLITAAVGTAAALAAGLWVLGTGAMIANTGSVDEDAQLVVATTGSAPTAGKFRLIVEYMQPKAS